jgi:hypothetical protein
MDGSTIGDEALKPIELDLICMVIESRDNCLIQNRVGTSLQHRYRALAFESRKFFADPRAQANQFA